MVMKINNIKKIVNDFLPYVEKKLNISKPVKIEYISDTDVAADPFGKTGEYSPETQTIKLFILGRHPKDILRSLAHEMTHHMQYCNGQLSDARDEAIQGYAQNNKHLRSLEKQAYLQSGILVRDWTDTLDVEKKREITMLKETKQCEHKEVKKVKKFIEDNTSIQDMNEDRLMKINSKLMDKFIKKQKEGDKND